MGFLRKVGRKIKKGVKKLFSSKIGALVGSIAIGMILGPAIGEAWKGIKGAVMGTGTTAAATGTTAAATGTTAAATGTTAAATGATATTTTAEALASSINMPSTLSTASSVPSGQINMAAIEKSITSGPFNVSNTVTGSINNVASSFNLPGFNTKAFETTLANVQPSPDLAFDTSTLTSTVADSTTTVPKTKQPFFGEGGKLREYGQNVKKDFQEGFSVGDIAEGVVTGYATTSLLSGDQADEGGYGRVATGSPDVQAQASYIQDISSSYNAAMGTTGLPNFSTIAQQTLYGNGSPQSFYQPLNLPNIG